MFYITRARGFPTPGREKKVSAGIPSAADSARMKIGFGSDWIFIYLRQEKFPGLPARDVFINDLRASLNTSLIKNGYVDESRRVRTA